MRKKYSFPGCYCLLGLLALSGCGDDSGNSTRDPPDLPDPPDTTTLDLNDGAASNGILRVSGSVGTGRFGLPVAGGFDCNGDGSEDLAMASMLASPQGRRDAGQVFLVFGDGTTGIAIDTAVSNARVLEIHGVIEQENTGSEIWMDDVTGDGLCDIIIGRQNHTDFGRIGAGAVSIIVGQPMLADMAARDEPLDLAAPAIGLNVVTFVGAEALDRLGMWMRTGDVDGDGVMDLAVGADQADTAGEANSGTAYLIRGGAHLDVTATVNLDNFGATALVGQIAKLDPPTNSTDYHFGATLSVGDLDDNGRAEVYVAAALNRSGGTLPAAGAPAGSAVGTGGNPGGSLFIYWDDNIPLTSPWPAGLTINFGAAPGSTTRIDGGTVSGTFTNSRFGEELLGGADYNNDGNVDLFVGDIVGSPANRNRAGLGHVLFSAANAKNLSFNIATPPVNLEITTILGPSSGDISTDTAAHGDFDGDGVVDLAVSSPLNDPEGRVDAGSIQILWGQSSWPAVIDLAPSGRPDPNVFAISDILGAAGETSSADLGDTLMYSAAVGDIDQDGRTDLIVNEMRGNGVAATTQDVGNLIVIPGRLVPR